MEGVLAARASEEVIGNSAPALLGIWIYFNLISNTVFLPILVGTFIFSTHAKRHPTLINVCMTWIFSGIFSLLLFYAGMERPNSPEPPLGLCIAQTSLLHGITPMWSVAILVLVYYVTIVVNGDPERSEMGRAKMILLLSAPYVAEVAFTIATLIGSLTHPERVNRKRRYFYCSLEMDSISNAMAIFTFIMCLGITALEIQLGSIIYRNWRGMRRAGYSGSMNLNVIVRVLLFGIYIFLGMVVNIISLFDENNLLPDMYAATVGTVVLLVFGTQSDVFRTWCFWRKDTPRHRLLPIYLAREPNWRHDIDIASPEKTRGEFQELVPPPQAHHRD